MPPTLFRPFRMPKRPTKPPLRSIFDEEPDVADTKPALSEMAELKTNATAAAQERTLGNGTDGAAAEANVTEVQEGTEPQSATGVKEHTENSKDVEKPTAADKNEESATAKVAEEVSDRKRKHSPVDTRDWRQRRDEDNRRDREHDRGHGHGRNRDNDRGRYDGRDKQRNNRGRGGRPYVNYRDNIRTDYEGQAETSDPDAIRKQVEFYFSESNLLMDKFLLSLVEGSKNKPVAVKTIHNFKRMRHFQPYSAVVAALRESTMVNIIGSEGQEEIQLKIPLPENVTEDPDANITIFEDATRPRSIYAKGFGKETATSQFDIEKFFAPYGPVNAVRLRRSTPDMVFKGSVFVEFDSEETARQFLELDPKPKWNDTELKIMSKEAYVTQKAEDIKAGKIKPSRTFSNNDRRGNYDRGRGGKGGNRGRGRGRNRDADRDGGHRRRYRSRSRSRSRSPRDSRSRSRSPYRSRSRTPDRSRSHSPVHRSSRSPEVVSKSPVETTAESKKRGRDQEKDDDRADASSPEIKKAKTVDDVTGA